MARGFCGQRRPVHNRQDAPDLMVLFTELVDCLHQRGDILRIGMLRDAVPQVEHVAAAIAIAAQYLLDFVADDLGGGEQNRRVEIAL